LATSFVLIFHFENSHYINITLAFKAKTKNKIINPKTSIYLFTVPKEGRLTGEFDLLIGVAALVNDWKLATNNERHYLASKDFFGLEIENWLTVTL